MSIYECHIEPDRREFTTEIIEARPGAVVLARSWLHPGGGGQPCDRARLESAIGYVAVTGVEVADGRTWHLVETDAQLSGSVHLEIDWVYRSRVAQLHTGTHILNALVFQRFQGALVTGAKINGDGTAHMDFDLPDVDNARVRALEGDINDVIRGALTVRSSYVTLDEAASTPGLVRNPAVAPPPTADGRLRRDRNRRARSAGMRRDAPYEYVGVAARRHHENRQQGPA